MNLRNNTNRITETAVITMLMTMFALLGIYLIPFIIIFYPIPFIVLGVRHGIKFNVLALFASSLLVGILVDITTGFLIFIIMGSLAITLAYMIRKRFSPTDILIISSGIVLIFIILTLYIISYITGVDFSSQLDTSFTLTLNNQLNIIKDMGLSDYEMAKIKDILQTTVEYMIIIIPTILMVSAFLLSYLNYWISTVVLKRIGYKTTNIPNFSKLRLPGNIILGTLILFLGASLIKYLKIFYYEAIFLNITTFISFIFFIEGLSLIVYLMNKSNINKFLKAVLILFIVISFPLSVIISIVGLLDVIFDFRKLKKSK